MFTGIISEIGTLKRIRRGSGWRITIAASRSAASLSVGDSIAVSGVCLSAVAVRDSEFDADVSRETLDRSRLKALQTGTRVNLELPLPVDGRFHGHIVQGHVDGTGRIIRITGTPNMKEITIHPDRNPGPWIVEKGSIAVDGISLTVAHLENSGDFTVAVIPITIAETTLGSARVGEIVNLEFDIIGKYVARNIKI